MIVRLCQTQLTKLGAPGAKLVSTVRDMELRPTVAQCLDRCHACERQLVASVDGIPISANTVPELLELIDALADDETR